MFELLPEPDGLEAGIETVWVVPFERVIIRLLPEAATVEILTPSIPLVPAAP